MVKISLVYYVLLLFCLSCAAIKKTENDPFIGKYKMTVFNVDGVGDVPAVLTIDKGKKVYSSQVNYKVFDEERILDVIATYPIDSSTIIIESLIDGSQWDFELNFESSIFSGFAGGIFEIEGEKIE
tara:strand:- start:3134 stop:3511 length:378 start_codon:yes stop_codon:yes gene_type:complete